MKFSEKFIKANDKCCDFDNFVPAPYLRKEFKLDFVPQKAEITVCGLGFYELYINGVNVTKGFLAPYISNTNDICYYDNYDICEYLNKGSNVIGILLGNGFRNCYGGFVWKFEQFSGRGPVTAALCLEAENGDDKFELEADETFKTHASPILYDDLRMGYCYDSRLEIPDWNMPGFDDSEWDFAKLEKKPGGEARLCEVEPIKTECEVEAVEIKHYDRLPFAHRKSNGFKPFENSYRDNVYVYDFGYNTAGVTKLKINGKPGQKITVRHGEYNINGEFSISSTIFQNDENPYLAERYMNYGQTDVFICKGGEETFVPKFKYDGFRYAYVEGLEPQQATKSALTYLVMHSDVKERGAFDCSDEVINKLQMCTRNSDVSNFYYFPTDCPHREKNGWTADAWFSAEHMLLNLTVEKSLREWLFNIRYNQRPDGGVYGIIPTAGWGKTFGPVWDSVCVEIPYYLYKYTGNTDIITENAAMIMRYLFYMLNARNEKGLVEFGLGDWCDPFEHKQGYISAPSVVTSSIATFNFAKKAEFLFARAGLKNESAYAKAIADEMRLCIRENLIDYDTMTVKGDCQTSQAVAIALGIFNDCELEAAQKRLVDIIHRDGDVNACGVYGLRYIYHVLGDMGEYDLAHKIITSKSHSCYGHFIDEGATTLWETFDTVDSKNHHFFGDISSWFIQYIAGIRPNPDADDISHFVISPCFVEKMDYAKAHFDSCFGRVSASWQRQGDKVMLKVTLPPAVHGKIVLNGGYLADNENKVIEFNKSENKKEYCITCFKK